MEIDTRFPTKLNTVSDAPEPLRGALVESFPSGEPARLLVHAPAFATEEEKSPATVLAVTNNGWLVASETEGGGAAVEKSNFSETLYLELNHVSHHEGSGVLALQVHAAHGGEELKIIFPSDDETAVSKAMEHMLLRREPEKQ